MQTSARASTPPTATGRRKCSANRRTTAYARWNSTPCTAIPNDFIPCFGKEYIANVTCGLYDYYSGMWLTDDYDGLVFAAEAQTDNFKDYEKRKQGDSIYPGVCIMDIDLIDTESALFFDICADWRYNL